MVDCVDILRSITKSCGDNVGGVNKRVWITQLQQIESYTYDSLGYVNSITTKEVGTTNYGYELKKVISKKGSHSGNVEAIENVNVDVFKHTAILKAYATTPEQRDSLVSLYGASKVVVFFETDNGEIEIYGLENGLYATALTGNTGEQMQDDTAFTFTLSGLQTSLPKYFLYGGSLHTSIAYLDNIGLTPIQSYSFSAKFSSVSSLDLTGCFLDSIGNNCATLINWGDGTIDSNLTHTYSISGDYVVSVACSDAFEITISNNSINEFYYAISIGLQNLYLSDTQIVDFNPSIALPIGLQILNLGSNQIVNFNPSIALPIGLQYLELGGNQIVDFNPSIALPIGLQNLYLSENQIVDFNPSIALPSGLQRLDLSVNQIVDFNPSIALPIGLQRLGLSVNQIVDFNPSIALPIGLQYLYLGDNQMTIAGYTASETWANAQPSFTSSCNIYFNDNIDSVSGTDLETILISKNCTIIV